VFYEDSKRNLITRDGDSNVDAAQIFRLEREPDAGGWDIPLLCSSDKSS